MTDISWHFSFVFVSSNRNSINICLEMNASSLSASLLLTLPILAL
jgi:hypothetical protein